MLEDVTMFGPGEYISDVTEGITREHISRRIAIDMQRDAFIDSQNCTIKTLHYYRTGEIRKTG